MNAVLEDPKKIVDVEAEFYKQKFYFSYSSLNKLLWSPGAFYTMYVLGQKEERTDAHLVQGKIIHGLMLEEDKFKDQFIVSPANLPKDNYKLIADRVFYHHQQMCMDNVDAFLDGKLSDYPDEIITILQEINLHQSLKTDQQRIDKMCTPEAMNYFDFLKAKGNKTLIDQESYAFCKAAVDIVKEHPVIRDLLGMDVSDFDNAEVYNEEFMTVELSKYPFGLKGFIDNIKVDHDKGHIYVNDLKTSGKELKDFEESIEYFSYWLQAVIYLTMVSHRYQDLLEKGYELKFHFIVIDRNFQSYAFPVTEKTLIKWQNRAVDILNIAEYHYTQRRYELPYHFDKGLITL